MINFTNPFISDATLYTFIQVKISTVFTNPSSTRPTSTFKFYTYGPNGAQIAYIDNAITVQMLTPASFNNIIISRISNKNYDLTTYSFEVSQNSPY